MIRSLVIIIQICLITLHHSYAYKVIDSSLFKCLNRYRHSSVFEVFKMLPLCDVNKFCREQDFIKFDNTLCGYIKSLIGINDRRWWINQNSMTTLKWDFMEFNIHRVDAECSYSRLEVTAEQKISRLCGYHMPWYQFTTGSVQLFQHFDINLKVPSSFRCFFQIYRIPDRFPSHLISKFNNIAPKLEILRLNAAFNDGCTLTKHS